MTASTRPLPLTSLAVPRKGHVLSTAAEFYGQGLRRAIGVIKPCLRSPAATLAWQQLYAPRGQAFDQTDGRSLDELGAWQLVATWVVGVATGAISQDAGLDQAEAWFLGRHGPNGLTKFIRVGAREAAEVCLRESAEMKAYAELLPYILDPHGQGSRLSVRKRPETAEAREQKKGAGVFYTPRDVADFMVKQTLEGLEGTIPCTVLDPACGTGVFLRSILAALHGGSPSTDIFDLACSSLYGTDIDSWALNAAAFVLLHDCGSAVAKRNIPPVSAWHALRLNLAQQDALNLDPGVCVSLEDTHRLDRLECRAKFKAGNLAETKTKSIKSQGAITFDVLFPEIAPGPRFIIGNPPYAQIGKARDLFGIASRFQTLRAAPRSTSDMSPLFVEQMIRLTAPDAHGGAMVLPLSIACNTGKQFVALRTLIAETAGHWRFAFFDREPHALFGEDVKTRNTIIVWTRKSNERQTRISSGPLRKWRAEGRARMLEAITFTPVSADIRCGVPKVGGIAEAAAFMKMQYQNRTLEHIVQSTGRLTLQEALVSDDRKVFVGATAYNFLNVFLAPQHWSAEDFSLTEHPLHALSCANNSDAVRIFALLSSRLAFWWWHTNGDGFHVSANTLKSMPVGSLFRDSAYEARLAEVGRTLWNRVQSAPVVSVNRGRTSLAFSANAYGKERTQVDELLIEALGLPSDFAGTLERFTQNVASAEISLDLGERNNQRKIGT